MSGEETPAPPSPQGPGVRVPLTPEDGGPGRERERGEGGGVGRTPCYFYTPSLLSHLGFSLVSLLGLPPFLLCLSVSPHLSSLSFLPIYLSIYLFIYLSIITLPTVSVHLLLFLFSPPELQSRLHQFLVSLAGPGPQFPHLCQQICREIEK